MPTVKDLINDFESRGLKAEEVSGTQMKVCVDKGNLLNHLRYVQSLGFEHLAFMSGVDYIDEDQFEVIYHTYSYTHKIHLMNKVRIDRKKPVLPTAVELWEQAQYYEQEVHEFFGIVFEGNKDLSGLFLHNWLDLPPLRKDFDTRKYSIKAYGASVNGGGSDGQ